MDSGPSQGDTGRLEGEQIGDTGLSPVGEGVRSRGGGVRVMDVSPGRTKGCSDSWGRTAKVKEIGVATSIVDVGVSFKISSGLEQTK